MSPEKIFPKKILDAMPSIETSVDMSSDKVKVPLKVFNAAGGQTWYLTAYDPEDRIFWCYANLGNPMFAECGTVSQDEMLDNDAQLSPLILMLERDFYWNPDTTLQEVIDKVQNGVHV